MKVLVVGGSGMIGATTARYLKDQGADVTVGVRSPLAEDSPVADLPVTPLLDWQRRVLPQGLR